MTRRRQTKSIEQRAKELGLTVDELHEFTSLLFGDQPDEAARDQPDAAARDQPAGGDAFGPSVSRVPSESEIAALPERTASIVRELEAKRAAKLTEILGCIATLMGHKDLASLDAQTRAAIERTALEVVEHWERKAELAKPSRPLITTNLQRLLHEHYELGENIHACLDEAWVIITQEDANATNLNIAQLRADIDALKGTGG